MEVGRCPDRTPRTGQATRGRSMLLMLLRAGDSREEATMTASHMSRRAMLRGVSALGALAAPSGKLLAQGARRTVPLPLRRELVIRNATVLTMDPNIADLARGDVHVRDGSIVAVGP